MGGAKPRTRVIKEHNSSKSSPDLHMNTQAHTNKQIQKAIEIETHALWDSYNASIGPKPRRGAYFHAVEENEQSYCEQLL